MRARKLFVGILLIALVICIGWVSPTTLAQPGLPIDAVVVRDANLRAGPGTTYAIIGATKAGAFVTVTDCAGDFLYQDFQVMGADPHGFDRDHDGIGCES